jgi:hypothetical protein
VVANDVGAGLAVTITARDDRSGVTSVSGWIGGPAGPNGQTPKTTFTCERDPNNPEGPWVGRILVPPFAAKGPWRLGLIRLFDKALNQRDYTAEDPLLARVVIEVR